MTITADLIDTLATKAGAFGSSPLCISVSCSNLVTRQKKAFGRTLEVGFERLVAGLAPNKCVMLAMDFKARSQNLQCSCQALERIPSLGRGRASQFIPIRFVFRNKVTRDDKLLVTFDALVLSETLGRTIDYGKVLHGDNYASLRVKTSAFADDVRRLIEKIGGLVASSTPPDLVLNRHCTECQYQTRCRQKAVDRDELSLLRKSLHRRQSKNEDRRHPCLPRR